jgi:hypothetical protein
MVWVRSEYAGELAVLSAWLSVLAPWNVAYSTGVAGGDVLFVRFPFFQVRYTYGVPVADGVTVQDVLSALSFQSGQTIAVAYRVWVVGAAVLAAALVLSVVYYAREDHLEAASLDPVRAMGVLLTLGGLALAVSTYLLVTRGFPGILLPVGVVLQLVLGVVLLRVERTDR